MASLSNINGIFDVHSTGAILFSNTHGTSGQILRSNGNAAPTWVAASTVIGGPYLPLTGGTLTGATATASGISFTVGGNLTVGGNAQAATFNGLAINTTGTNNVANQIVRTEANGYVNFGWINSISGATTSTITRITASNDAYLRYVTPATFRTQITDPYYAPAGTVSGVTSVATGNGLTGGTITSTGTLTMSGDYTGSLSITGANLAGTSFSDPDIVLSITDEDTTASIRNKMTGSSAITKISDATAPAPGCFQVNGSYYPQGFGPYYKISEGDEFTFEFWMRYVSGTATYNLLYAGSNFYNAAGTYLGNSQRYWGESSLNINANTGTGWYHVSGTLGPNRGSATGDIPTTAESMKLLFLFNYSPNGTIVTNYCGLKVYKSNPTVTKLYRKTLGSEASSSGRNRDLVIDSDGDIFGKDITATGNSFLGNANGDYVHVNDKLYVGATDSGNAEFWFGEGTTGDVNYGARWYWDSGYTHQWYTVNNSTETLMMSYATNDTSKLQWFRNFEMSGNIGRSAHNVGFLVGGYNNVGASEANTSPIYAIGTNYLPTATALSNMYGIGYARGDAAFMGVAQGIGWGMYVAADGDARIFLDAGNGDIYANNRVCVNSYANQAGGLLFSAGQTTGTTRSLNLRTTTPTGDPSNVEASEATGITWGQRTDSNPYYIIKPTRLNFGGGNYSKLTLNWHTGIRIGAQKAYGGTKFYNDSPDIVGETGVIMNVGVGNNNIGIVNALTVGGNVTAASFIGNASTSTTFSTGRTNYKGVTDAAVIGQMMWKNYGNNHTIFDASSGTSPQGNVISNTNSINAWGATYPTLMGWNGSSTYGVRVDSARVADSTTGSAGTLTHNANRVDSSSYPVVWMSGSPSPAYSCAAVTITSSAGRINATALQFNYTQHGSANNIRMGNSTTMNAISSGTNNAAFGVEALGGCSTGSRNFAYGYAALYSLSSGGSNIAMGDATGYNVTSGSNNLLFGQNAGRTGYQSPYQSIAGVTSGSNQIHMGNESHSTARIQISWTVNSDSRDKTDVTPIDVGLDFVKDLNPVTFRWDKRSDYEDRIPTGKNKLEELTLGFLAQEVEEVEKSYGYDVANKTNLVVDRDVDQDHFGITYEKMIPILVKAIQELEIRVKELENK
jgi:hypothetical protein